MMGGDSSGHEAKIGPCGPGPWRRILFLDASPIDSVYHSIWTQIEGRLASDRVVMHTQKYDAGGNRVAQALLCSGD